MDFPSCSRRLHCSHSSSAPAGWAFPPRWRLAFLPVLLRGTFWFVRRRQPLDVHKLGFSELGQSLLFGALLCTAFLL